MRRNVLNWTTALGLAMAVMVPGSYAQAQSSEARASSFAGAYLAGRVAETDNDLESAIRFYQRAVQLDPSNLELKNALLISLVALGRFDEALPLADQLKTIPEAERISRVALAIDAFRNDEFAEAERLLTLALESDLDRLITGLMRAWARSGAGNHVEAQEALDNLNGPPWFDLFVSYHRALLHQRGGDTDAAIAAFDATMENVGAASAAPETYLRAAESYAVLLATEDRDEDALEILDRAEELFSARVQIARLREQIEAGDTVEPLVASPAHGASEVLLNLGAALNRGGGESFVRIYLRMALALRPDSDITLLLLATVAEAMQEPETAIGLYERIPDASPLKKLAELQMGLNLADLDRHEEAEEHLRAVLEMDADDMRAYLALGGVYASQEKYREAADNYDRAIARIDEPTRAEWNIYYQRGIAYERLKEWPKAEPNFRKALELFPNQPQVLNYLGYSWVDMNMNLEEGLEMIKTAVELRPSDGYIVDSLGWAYYRLGRYEDAVRELERAVGLMPNDPILNDHLGDAYWRVGRRLEAGFQWNHARDLDPEPELLAQVLEKIEAGLADERLPTVADDPSPMAPATEVPLPRSEGGRTEAEPVERTATVSDQAMHQVTPGQSLWSIAAEKLGNGNRYQEILDLNPELRGDPGRLMPGQSLNMPGN